MSYKTPLASNTKFGLVKAGTGVNIVDGTLNASTGLLNYGFFTDGTQTNPVANTVNLVTLGNTGPINGISVVGGSAITVVNAGTYTLMFTVLVGKTSGGTDTVSFWLRYNGADIPASAQDLQLTNTLAQVFTSGNFTLDMTAGSNIQLCWSSPDITAALTALPARVTPTRPTGASAKITLTRIS
jgi:hypothetical protein